MALGAAALALFSAAQEPPKMLLESLGKDFTFTEGPVWSRDGFLIFSDTATDRIFKLTPGSDPVLIRKDANGPSGNAFDSQGRLYTCETHARRITRTGRDNHVEVLIDQFEGKKLNAPNDVTVSKNDHIYFTDPAFGQQADHRELDFYGVYHIPPKGAVKLIAKPTGRPNGIALSPNGKILYVTNSDERNVRAYDIDRNGDGANERVVIAKTVGVPGGIRVGEKGELYVATAKGISIYAADGKFVRTHELHDPPSNCAIDPTGGIYLTSRNFLYLLHADARQ